jgi:hypothetical protein
MPSGNKNVFHTGAKNRHTEPSRQIRITRARAGIEARANDARSSADSRSNKRLFAPKQMIDLT